MADSELKECPCSNITIMQLFHELKQRYPKIPDHIVSKVIEQNFHDKSACETILQRESQYYLQTYPGALISGTIRGQNESLSKQCCAPRIIHPHRSVSKNGNVEGSSQYSASKQELQGISTLRVKNIQDNVSDTFDGDTYLKDGNACSDKHNNKLYNSGCSKKLNLPLLPLVYCRNNDFENREVPESYSLRNKIVNREEAVKANINKQEELIYGELNSDQPFSSSSSSLGTYLGSFTEEEEQKDRIDLSSEISAVITDRTPESGCDSGTKKNISRSQSSVDLSSPKGEKDSETRIWIAEDGDGKSTVVSGIIPPSESPLPHKCQIAVECTMQPITSDSQRNPDQTRPFTSLNLHLRPPSSEPQLPIEIQSKQSLIYITSFNPRKGYQSQLQIRFDSELLEKQRERKDLLARELRREKEKLRCMKNEVRLMTVAIEQRPNPHILPKLKAEILRLRTECERLTAAVDLYSDNQGNLPLGETNEEFYRNIYTGQRFQREGSWSCQLCTFRNHPLLTACEECGMPRLSLGTAIKDVTTRLSNVFSNNSNTSFCTAAGTSASASLITAPLQEQ